MTEVSEEFPTDASDSFGYKSLGHPIQLVSDYNEQLPYKHINNFAYAPHTGLFAAAGKDEIVIGKLNDLKHDLSDSAGEFTTGKHIVSIGGINSVSFTRDEKTLIISIENAILSAPIDTSSYTSLSIQSFSVTTVDGSVEKITPCPSSTISCAVLDGQSQLHTFQAAAGKLNRIATDVVDFSFSPKGKQIAIAKKDGTIKQITLDGTEKASIPSPEDVQDENMLPISVTWISPHTLFASYGVEQEYDSDNEPSYDLKFYIIEQDKAANTIYFKESFDAVPAFGSVWRKQAVYSSTIHNLSDALPLLSLFASSTSAEITAITPSDVIQSADDSTRAALPLNGDTGNDVNAIGLITDVKLKETVIEPCPGVSEASWLPTVWVLGQDGKVQGWYIYHVHDLKANSFKQDGPLAYEDELFALASGQQTTTPNKSTSETIKSPFASKTTPAFGQSPVTAKPAFSFGAPTQSSTSAFGSSGFGSSANTNTAVPSFGSTGFGSNTITTGSGTTAAPSFGSTGFGSTSTNTAAPSFGSTGFGSNTTSTTPATTAPSFGFTGFGSKSTSTTAPAPSFGSTGLGSNTTPNAPAAAFGSSGFGSSANTGQAAPSFGSSTLGTSAFGSSGFGSSGFGSKQETTPAISMGSSGFSGFASKNSNASPFETLAAKGPAASPFGAIGSKDTGSSPFATLGSKDTSASPFAAFGNTTSTKTDSPFSSLSTTEQTTSTSSVFGNKQSTASPFGAFGTTTNSTESSGSLFTKVADSGEKTASPFGALTSNNTNAQSGGLFGSVTSDVKKSENVFSFGNSFGSSSTNATPFGFGAKKEPSSVNDTASSSLFGKPQPASAPLFNFSPPTDAKPPTDQGSMNFGSFLSGTEQSKSTVPESEDDDAQSEDDNDVSSSDDEPPLPVPQPPQPTQTINASAPQAPRTLGESTMSGFEGFGSSAFNNSSYKPSVAPSLDVGSSDNGNAVEQELPIQNQPAEEAYQQETTQAEEEEGEGYSLPQVDSDELQTDPSDDSQSESAEDEDDETSDADIPEDSFEGFDDTRDQTGLETDKSDEESDRFEDLEHSDKVDTSRLANELSFVEEESDGSDDVDDDQEEHERGNDTEADMNNDIAAIKIDDGVEDPEISDDLKESLDEKLVIDTDVHVDSIESLKSSNDEALYLEAQKLNPDGSDNPVHSDGEEDDDDNLRSITIVERSTQAGPEYGDAGVNAVPETTHVGTHAAVEYINVSVQSEPIIQESISVEAFEGDEAYIGSFDLPKLIPPYVHLGDVNYPPLSNDDVIRELEVIVYDTEAELMAIEENVRSLGDVLVDHLNPSVIHTEATLDRSEQWRLSEASTINNIVTSKLIPTAKKLSEIESQLKHLESLKESIDTQSKWSITLKDKLLALERSVDPALLSVRGLPFDAQLLQTKVRSTFNNTSNYLREAEQRLLSLKTAANVFHDAAPTAEMIEGIISHINSVTREYSNDTKTLTEEIAKLNDSHQKILEGVQQGNNEFIKKSFNQDKGSTLAKVDETQRRINTQSLIADEFGGRLVFEVTSRF